MDQSNSGCGGRRLKRQELRSKDSALFEFISMELLPCLHRPDVRLDGSPNSDASLKQRVIARIMTAVERVRVDSCTR